MQLYLFSNKKTNAMSKSFMPQKDGDLLSWLQNFKTKISIHSGTLGLSPAQITDYEKWCDTMTDAIVQVRIKKDAYQSAVSAKNDAAQTQLGAIRLGVANIKTLAVYTDAIGSDLGIVAINPGFDVVNYKAQISAEVMGGFVRIRFKKLGADGVNIYHRLKGSPNWLFLARDTKSPYDDHIQLAVANQPEHWEYMAYGVLDDEQIGQQSDIVPVLFG